MQLTKKAVTALKEKGSIEVANFVDTLPDDKSKLYVLDNLGKLPKGFEGNWLASFLVHSNPKIRLSAVKNVAKLKTDKFNKQLLWICTNEPDTVIRREAVSAIGRQRNPDNKKLLIDLLEDFDPKVVMQAIRALLVFKKDDEIAEKLKELTTHPNEMIQEVIRRELAMNTSKKSSIPHAQSPDFMKNYLSL